MDISVVIPVYNAEKYVESAVDSALLQKEVAEIILVEDNSPDNALEICQRLEKAHPRVTLLQHSDGENHGAGESRNLGIRKARCEYIAFLDADDYYLENCFAKAAEVLESDPGIDGVYGAVGAEFETEEAKRRYFLTHYEEVATVDEKVTPEQLFRFLVLGGAGYIHLNGLVVKKAGLLEVGLLPKLRLHQDMVLTIKLAAKLRLAAGQVNKPVSIRRLHLDNRITNLKTDFSATQLSAHKYLLNWSRQEHLPREQQEIIRKKYWRLSYRHHRKARNYPAALYFYTISRLFGNQ
jgi:glycosyltransferase involved in cell wall biosynthesis